jgi:hypothetical protein
MADRETVFAIEGNSISVHLTLEEVQMQEPSISGLFRDIDVDANGVLYVLVGRAVVRSNGAHQATFWRGADSLIIPQYMNVVVPGHVAIVDGSDGLWSLTDNSLSRVYTQDQIGGGGGCALRDIAAAPSGVFLYQPGCNGFPLYRGNIDGAGIGAIYRSESSMPSALHAWNFQCSARDPYGGFYVLVEDYTLIESQLYHLTEDASGSTGVVRITTVPSFPDVEGISDDFFYCSLAAGTDGNVYARKQRELWKVSPMP